jgi:hypothetical protein
MFCARKMHTFSLLLLTATTMRGAEDERKLSFNTDRRDERPVLDGSKALVILGCVLGGGLATMAAKECMPLNDDNSTIYKWTQNTLITPHDVNAIARISATSLTFSTMCAPDVAKQFREFAIRAPIAGAVYALSRSKFAQKLYPHVILFGEALRPPTKEMKAKYPFAGEMTSGVVAIATYKALDPAISYVCKRVHRWWHGVYNESTDTHIDYKKVS